MVDGVLSDLGAGADLKYFGGGALSNLDHLGQSLNRLLMHI